MHVVRHYYPGAKTIETPFAVSDQNGIGDQIGNPRVPEPKGGPMHDDPGHDRRPRKRVRELGRRRHFHWPPLFPTAARSGTAMHRWDGNAVVSFGNRPLVRVGRRNRLPHQISVSTTWEFSQKCRNSRGWLNACPTWLLQVIEEPWWRRGFACVYTLLPRQGDIEVVEFLARHRIFHS